MNHTIDAATLAEGLAEMRAERARLAELAETSRTAGDREAGDAYDGAAGGVTALVDAIEGSRFEGGWISGEGVGAALANSTRAYRHLTDVLAARNG